MLTLYIDFSDAQGQKTPVSGWIWLKIKLIQAFMHALVSCKNEKVPIRKALELSHCKSMGIFSDGQGHLTQQSMVRSGQIFNSSETFWLSLLPAKIKKI